MPRPRSRRERSCSGEKSEGVNPAAYRVLQKRFPGPPEVMAHGRGIEPGVDPAEQDAQPGADHVGQGEAAGPPQVGRRRTREAMTSFWHRGSRTGRSMADNGRA